MTLLQAAVSALLYQALTAGTHAEYVATKEVYLCRLPSTVNFEQAGAIPCVAHTAWMVSTWHGTATATELHHVRQIH